MRENEANARIHVISLARRHNWACEGEGEVAVFSAKRLDRRSSEAQMESATSYHDAHVLGSYRVSSSLRLTVLTAKSEDSPLRYNAFNQDRVLASLPCGIAASAFRTFGAPCSEPSLSTHLLTLERCKTELADGL